MPNHTLQPSMQEHPYVSYTPLSGYPIRGERGTVCAGDGYLVRTANLRQTGRSGYHSDGRNYNGLDWWKLFATRCCARGSATLARGRAAFPYASGVAGYGYCSSRCESFSNDL